MTRLPFHNKKSIKKIVSGLQIEKFQEILKEGNGCILVTGHLGNWEYAGMALATAGLPINAVSKPLKMESLDRFLNHCRLKSSIKTINQKNAYREMLKVLKNNEVVVLLLDFDTAPEKGGIFVPFFGEMAASLPTAAMLQLKTKSPIIVTRLRRDSDLIHSTVEIDQIIYGSDCLTKEEKIYDITKKINESYERFIVASPPEWLWLQRRWRFPYTNKLQSANNEEENL
jgi:KDO2-lipid IV(A) lauroyltransferase